MQSLFAQTFHDWRLLVRDDGSTDETVTILKDWQKKDPDRIVILDCHEKHLGPKKSFESLLSQTEAETILFCDQDDVWLPDKIENSRVKMEELERNHPGKPVLIFTDLKVVDDQLQAISPSFWKYMKVSPENVRNPYKLLINNPVVGCTVMINQQVKAVVLPFPEQAVMHDWWMALNVARKGFIDYLNRPSVLYRLHANNNIGATRVDAGYYAGRIKHFSKTFSQNKEAVEMLKALDFPLSPAKFWLHKVVLTLSKIF